MVAILVLATFMIFVLVDFYFQRRKERPVLVAKLEGKRGEAAFPIDIVSGFSMLARLSYNAGRAWAFKEGRRVVRIGMDDLAARPLGAIGAIQYVGWGGA